MIRLLDLEGAGRFEAWSFPPNGAYSGSFRIDLPAMPGIVARAYWKSLGRAVLPIGKSEYRVAANDNG